MPVMRRWLYALFPSSLELVVHLNTDDDTYEIIYQKKWCGWWNFPDEIPDNGYLIFKTWNHRYLAFDHILLSHDHVKKALGCNKGFMSVAPYILTEKLTEYVQKNVCNEPHAIMEILIDGQDKYMDMYRFMRSLYVPHNATPHLINLVHSWLSGTTCYYRHVQVTNYNYEPYELSYNQFLFTYGKSV